jgi:hypothetical protein
LHAGRAAAGGPRAGDNYPAGAGRHQSV